MAIQRETAWRACLGALALAACATGVPASAAYLKCESRAGERHSCLTDAPSDVRLVQRIGKAKCAEGRDWGFDGNGVWVAHGCRAVFDAEPTTGAIEEDSAEWQRGFADAQRGVAEADDASGDYRLGYRAGLDAGDDDAADDDSDEEAAPRRPYADSGRYADNDHEADRESPREDRDDNDDDDQSAAAPRDDVGGDDDDDDSRYEPRAASPSPEPPGARRYAGTDVDGGRKIARRACIDAAASGQRFGTNQVIADDAHWIGGGQYEVGVDTPVGAFDCIAGADGRVRALRDQ